MRLRLSWAISQEPLYFDNSSLELVLVSFAQRKVQRYHKIPKISPEAYIFQRPFLRGLFLEGPIFGGAYVRREICVSKSIGLAL